MGSNRNPRQIVDGKLRCGSKHHEGDRMVPVTSFSKKKPSPDGLDYSCKDCRRKQNHEIGDTTYKKWKAKNPVKALFAGRKSDAKKRGIEFTITERDVIIPEVCPVLGIPIVASGGSRTNNSPSIDRIDNNKGYVPGNVVVISWRANMLKKDATIEELIKMANFYKDKI